MKFIFIRWFNDYLMHLDEMLISVIEIDGLGIEGVRLFVKIMFVLCFFIFFVSFEECLGILKMFIDPLFLELSGNFNSFVQCCTIC